MENNDLEDKIRKMVKEKIAVSNIKEEFKMKENKNRKTINRYKWINKRNSKTICRTCNNPE